MDIKVYGLGLNKWLKCKMCINDCELKFETWEIDWFVKWDQEWSEEEYEVQADELLVADEMVDDHQWLMYWWSEDQELHETVLEHQLVRQVHQMWSHDANKPKSL